MGIENKISIAVQLCYACRCVVGEIVVAMKEVLDSHLVSLSVCKVSQLSYWYKLGVECATK